MLLRSVVLTLLVTVAGCASAASLAVPRDDDALFASRRNVAPTLYLARYVNGVSSIEVRSSRDGSLQRTLSGVHDVASMAADRHGTLYAFDLRRSQERRFSRVLEFAAGSIRPDVVIPRDHGSPFTVFVDSDDRLVVPDLWRSTLSFFNRGDRHPWRVTRSGLCWPWGLASDAASHLWISNQYCVNQHTRSSIVELGNEGNAVLRTITEHVDLPWRIALDGKGGVYVVSLYDNVESLNVYAMATGALVRSVRITNDRAGFIDSHNPSADSDGNVYVHFSGCVASSGGYHHCVDDINVYSPGLSRPPLVLKARSNEGFGHIAFDRTGNAYVLVGFGGTHPTSEVRVYSDGATKSRTLLKEAGLYDIQIGP